MSHTAKSFIYPSLVLALLVSTLAGCAPTVTQISPAPITSTATASPPTRTPLPTVVHTATVTPIPQPAIEKLTIPDCVEDGTGDTLTLYELFESFWQTLYEMDSYRYRTVYRYLDGNRYADDDLSIEVTGAHSSRLASPVEAFFYPLESQSFERSQVIQTDLRSGERTESIVTGDGFWVRKSDDAGWIAFDAATSVELLNWAEIFSPPATLFMVGGGGTLGSGVRTDAPAIMQAEILDGQEVIHRCWLPQTIEGSEINAYLIHDESEYTFLSDAELHVWTTPDDTQLVRLALTGKHIGERLGETEGLDHDTPSDFLLWVDISEVGAEVDILPPPADQIALTIPPQGSPAGDISAAYNDLPVPAGAVSVDKAEPLPAVPRELPEAGNSCVVWCIDVLGHLYRTGWYRTPADRIPMYEAEMSLSEAAAFYLDEMGKRGWQMKEKFVELSWPRLHLFFERDGVKLPVILETLEAGTTRIWAILPPADNILEAILSGWTTYTPQNSELSGDAVNAIAFDPQGKAWIGTDEGLNAFDGQAWIAYSAEELGLDGDRNAVSALAVDEQGRVWVGTASGLAVLDGESWKTYTAQNSKLPGETIQDIAVDAGGRVWMGVGGLGEGGVSVFDGKKFTNYEPGEIGLPEGHSVMAIVADPQGRVWIGTNGGGVYMFDGNAWQTVMKAKSPPHSTSSYIEDLAIDQQGRVWIGAYQGLSVFDGKDWITFTPENSGMPYQAVDALAVDEYDRVWVGGGYGTLSALETDGTWKDYTPVQEVAGGYSMNALAVDPEGRVWAGVDEGLNIFTPPEPAATVARTLPEPTPLPPPPTPMPTPGPGWTSYTTENSGLVSDGVSAVAVDGQGRVWAGTRGGVSVFSPAGEWTSYQMANSDLLADNIQTLAIDRQGRVWLGAGSSGLTVLAPDGTWQTYTPDNSDLPCEDVDGLMVDSQDRLWISTYTNCAQPALSALAPNGKWKTYTTKNSGLANDMVLPLAEDKQGRVWVVTIDGVSVLEPKGQWTNYDETDLGFTGDIVGINSLAVDEQDRVWLGSYADGLVAVAPDGSHIAYTTANSDLASDGIHTLLTDDAGRVWVGTDAGLSVLAPDGSWESYTSENSGLIEGSISSLAMDSQGRLWIGTDAGLGVFDPNAP